MWSPSLVMSLQIDTATFIPEASSASGSVVAKGSGSHHDTRATGTNRASSRVRSQLRVAVQGVAVLGGLNVGEDHDRFDPFLSAALLNRPTATRAASTLRHISLVISLVVNAFQAGYIFSMVTTRKGLSGRGKLRCH